MNFSFPTKDVSDTELEILSQLWDRGFATTREITVAIYEEPLDPQIATVQKLLHRLEKKGFVEGDRSQRPHQYQATMSKEAFLVRGVESLADKLCSGSISPVLSSLIHSQKLKPEDIQSLEKLITELESRNTPQRKKRRR